jgi:LuxR family maltose regulon positive regulatory protein
VREPSPESPADAELTPEELRLLGWLAEDRDTAEMARSLGVSVSTVREHLRRVFAKLGATGRGPWPPPPSRA